MQITIEDIAHSLIGGDQLIWLTRQGVSPVLLAKLMPILTASGHRTVQGFFEPGGDTHSFVAFEEGDDLVYWQPRGNVLATLKGRAFALNQGLVTDASTYALDGNLNIFGTVLDWLRADCDGIVVLDWQRAFDSLRDAPRIALAERLLPTYRKWMAPRRMPSLSIIPDRERIAA